MCDAAVEFVSAARDDRNFGHALDAFSGDDLRWFQGQASWQLRLTRARAGKIDHRPSLLPICRLATTA
jgi:hypothetical protein